MSDEMTDKIIGAAIEVHRNLGPGLLESIYEVALSRELDLRGILYERQKIYRLNYKGVDLPDQRIDLVVAGVLVVELKSVTHLPEIATAQVLSYLRVSGLQRGLILNFGEALLKKGIKRIAL